MTEEAPCFHEIWEEISKHIAGQHVVCHNAAFDLLKLSETLNFFDIEQPNLTYSCTMELFGGGLEDCCKENEIIFSNHHDALADAEACALLYLRYLELSGEYVPIKNDEPYSEKKIEKVDLVPDFEHADPNSSFFKKKIVFTGDLVNFTRTEAAHRIKLLGADVNTSISKKTDFVIIGRNPGPSKMEKIKTFQIPIISEDDFLKMLE
jgi:DNA polymerase-3 subunit epsilon